ncbi:MAG: hypothetical protein M3Q68_04075 [Actinomycetota bacterium]|nr:hypothetical protein [Actinomycetota bacterium]
MAVFVQSLKVGYIPRENAALYQAVLLDLHGQGRYGWCDGFVTGGWDRGDGDTGKFGLELDLAPPDWCVPPES